MIKQFFNTITQGSTATILLYGEVGSSWGVDPKLVVTEVMTLAQSYSQIDVRINSVGGDVFAGIAIYNALKNCSANITIYVDGLAASIAGVIALCGKPLYMSQHAKLMLHNVSGGAYGSAKEMRETAALIDNLEEDLAAMVAERLNMSVQDVRDTYFDGNDHWMTAAQAQSLGLIDGIFDGVDPQGVTEESTIEELYAAFSNRLREQAQPNKDMGLLEDIKTIPSLANVANEGEAVASIRAMASANAKVQEQEGIIAQQRQRIEELEAQELKAILDKAIAERKITEAQRPSYEALLKSDKANTLALLQTLTSIAPQASAQEWINAGASPANKFEGKSWRELDKAGLLEELKATNKTLFERLYKQEYGVEYKH